MNLLEHSAKALLRTAGILTPSGTVTTRPEEAARIASELGPAMVKAQVPTGGRARSGGIVSAGTVENARQAAVSLLGQQLGPHRIREVLVDSASPSTAICTQPF